MIIIFTIIGIAAFYGALNIVKKFDKESSIEINKEIGIIILILISTTLLYLKYKLTIDFIFIYYLSIYLIISAYIDYKTMYVYSNLNYITIIISIMYLLVRHNNLYMKYVVINVIIFLIFTMILSKLKAYGGGDNEIFIAISIFIAIKYQNIPLEALLINMLISDVLIIITNFKEINFKKVRFNKSIAFVPSIAISTMILLLI